jgi:hypothetical protein
MNKDLVKAVFDYLIILFSGLFDRDYYLKAYPDVRKAHFGPLWHFVCFGWKEYRNPSLKFNTGSYLFQNQDIDRVGINPLVHYILHGINENRYTNLDMSEIGKFLFRFLKIIKMNKDTLRLETLSFYQLDSELKKKLLSTHFMLSISQDNYLEVVGGIQMTIADEQTFTNNKAIDYLHIFPRFPRNNQFDNYNMVSVGVNLNGEFLGYVTTSNFLEIIENLVLQKSSEVVVHHLMGYRIDFVYQLLKIFNNSSKRFWLHDLFSVCPNYFLLRNHISYCGAPTIESNSCFICSYYDIRKKTIPEIHNLLDLEGIEIVAPSEYIFSFWCEKTDYHYDRVSIISHARLEWNGYEPVNSDYSQIRVAFVGSPMFHKGWDDFKALSDELKNTKEYLFYLLSSQNKRGEFKWIDVSVSKTDRFKMIKELKNNNIDIAILWSICPESYSYSLYESLSAGCFIITNPYSGNIQNYIKDNPEKGLVLENYDELLEKFVTKEIFGFVKEYQKKGKPQAQMVLRFQGLQ